MDDPASWLILAVTIVLAAAGARVAVQLVRRRRDGEDRQVIEQLRARVGDVRDVERDDAAGTEVGG